MKIYVVLRYSDALDGHEIVGVFSTQEKATEYRLTLEDPAHIEAWHLELGVREA